MGTAATGSSARPAVYLPEAIHDMVAYYSEKGNEWFAKNYWPENRGRATRMLSDLARLVAPGGDVFEPGCGNGYISYLAARTGYRVTATDAWSPSDREELFRRASVEFFLSNLNHLAPWPD